MSLVVLLLFSFHNYSQLSSVAIAVNEFSAIWSCFLCSVNRGLMFIFVLVFR